MPLTGGVRVTGLRGVIRDLEAAGVEVTDLTATFADLARDAAALAASFAPQRTGRLARSIKAGQSKMMATVRAGSAVRVPYAGPINYGWPDRNIKASGFMQKADRAIRPRVVPTIQAAIDRLIHERNLA